MRNVPLDEEDKELFGSYLNRTLYDVYCKNAAAFTQMWQEQGTSYWLKFCITLRSVLQKEGYPGLLVCNHRLPSYSEEFYIQLTQLLIGPNVDNVHEMIRDVVSISRFPQLWDNIAEVLLMNPEKASPCCARLFFKTPDQLPATKIFCLLPLYLRAVGCLMKLLQRWLTAKPLTTKEKIFWKPPLNWHQKKDIQTNIFEKHLQVELGSSVCFMLNIQKADIAWWDESLELLKPAMSKKHHTFLGEFIDEECLRNYTLSEHLKVKYYHIVTSQPRGKIFYHKNAYLVGFMISTVRGLFFVDDLDVFHPYSQAYISFYHSSFGPNFWYGEDGIEKHFRERLHRSSSDVLTMELSLILDQKVMAQTATSMNSHFYDTLYDGTTWTSVVTLIRLPWNMPLCLNWMEVLLIKIYEFERFLKPLRHFPLKKELHDILQKLLYRVEEASFLAKAVIILAENIHQNQDHQASMCYSFRKLLPDVIKKLANVMVFLEDNAYRILNVMLKSGWSIEEQETGENHSNDSSRMLVSLSAVNSIPDIDQYFAKNFRSIYFWLGNEEVPDIENGRKYAAKVAKLIQNFKSGSSRENNKKSDYDFVAFKRCVQGIRGIPGGEPHFTMIDLLVEDGWISKAEEKVLHYCHSRFEKVMDELESSQDFKRFSTAYFIAAYFLGEFKDCNISGLPALARLHRAESLAIMSDSGLKLSSMVQKHPSTPVPPPHFFKEAFREIHARCADNTDLTVEDATKLLQMIDQVKSTNFSTASEEALTDISVPNEVELVDPAVRLRWLECFEKKRVQLLQLVSEEQFKITQACQENKNAISRRCFPLIDVLEFRLIEEAAALRKTLEMDLKPIFVHNLVRLLAYRLNWLQNVYLAWKKEKNSWKPGNRPQQYTHKQMTKMNCKNFIGILSVKQHLQAIFSTLISKYGTTHPVCEITLNQMWIEARTAYSLCFLLQGIPICGEGPRYWEYCDSISKACAYYEQLVQHCKEVWNVPIFNCEPPMELHYGSAAHAEWIVTVFHRIYILVNWRNFLPQETAVIPPVVNKALTDYMVTAMALVTARVAYPQEDQESITELKATLKHIWFLLVDIKKHLKFAEDIVVEFLGDKHSKWIELLKLFCSNNYSNILVKIAFSEFINASETEWNKVIKQKIDKEKEAKIRKTICQEHKASAKEKMIMISDDKNKDLVNQESKSKLNEEKDKPVLQEGNVAVKEEKLIEVSHAKQPMHQQCKEEKADEKDNPMLVENEVTVSEENLIPVSDGKDKGSIHQKTKIEKEEKVVMTSNGNNQHISHVDSKDLNGAACQQADTITVKDKSESSANKEKVEVNKGSSSKLKVCNFCKKMEKKQRMFKKCHLCKKERWDKGYFFCSEECEAKDWIKMHHAVHKPE